jgi:hypothetical protein
MEFCVFEYWQNIMLRKFLTLTWNNVDIGEHQRISILKKEIFNVEYHKK